MNSIDKLTGQCHCGQIKYEVHGQIIKSSYCDCDGCRRATGTLKIPFVSVQESDFSIITGNPKEFMAESGIKCDAHGSWFFCQECGSHLFWKGHKGNELDLFAGSLDNTAAFDPKE